MTYREALKKTALFIPVSLLDRGLWRAIGEHAGELLFALTTLVGRLGAIALYPVAVPILAALVVAADRANERERERAKRAIHQYGPRKLRAGDATTSP
ncbi:hypothetical protein KDX10_32975 [Burkholderia cenocepacia]|uniref:hypothetical protein n=1 Tax=Burkholderia cenocepacia TaxID=95486 RepID=UPI001B9EA75D|nr:hypothetical protein [Burkholderia cenocepacia]MBR8114458.1 hypothetical protein [Burkholderia cenocepacia]